MSGPMLLFVACIATSGLPGHSSLGPRYAHCIEGQVQVETCGGYVPMAILASWVMGHPSWRIMKIACRSGVEV
jgi:hypothetical protein